MSSNQAPHENHTTEPDEDARPLNPDHIYLMQCIEFGGVHLDFARIGQSFGITEEAARLRYYRLRMRLYEAALGAMASEVSTGMASGGGDEAQNLEAEGEGENEDIECLEAEDEDPEAEASEVDETEQQSDEGN